MLHLHLRHHFLQENRVQRLQVFNTNLFSWPLLFAMTEIIVAKKFSKQKERFNRTMLFAFV